MDFGSHVKMTFIKAMSTLPPSKTCKNNLTGSSVNFSKDPKQIDLKIVIFDTPPKTIQYNMEAENTTLEKGETSTNHQFHPIVGFKMLVFGGDFFACPTRVGKRLMPKSRHSFPSLHSLLQHNNIMAR